MRKECVARTGAILLLLALTACADPRPRETDRAARDEPAATPSPPPRSPGMSGLARYRGHLFLAVHDTKRGQEGPRVSAISLEGDAPFVIRHLDLDWDLPGGLPSDLESIAPVPDRPGEFLLAESGHRDGLTGRIVRLRVTGDTLHEVGARVVAEPIELPEDAHRIEGMALLPRREGPTLLVTCERDERVRAEKTAPRHARLRWSEVDLDRGRLTTIGHTEIRALVWPEGGSLRTCSDLHLDESDDGATLWIAATVEPAKGDPHDSIVYRAATRDLLPDAGDGATMETAWRVMGSKVEGLAPPLRPGDGLTIATDEDAAGGEVRVLPGRREPR